MKKIITQVEVNHKGGKEIESSEVFEAKTLSAAKRKASKWFEDCFIETESLRVFEQSGITYMIASVAA